jgi:hypothetical protein
VLRAQRADPEVRAREPVSGAPAVLSVATMETATPARTTVDPETVSFAGLVAMLVLSNIAFVWVALAYFV